MNTQLVFLANQEKPVTTSLIISNVLKLQHKNVLELTRKYLEQLTIFGRVAFETQPFSTAGGNQSREIAYLNEHQATLLISMMRNTEKVIAFKVALVNAFYEMRQFLEKKKFAQLQLGYKNSSEGVITFKYESFAELRTKLDKGIALFNLHDLCKFFGETNIMKSLNSDVDNEDVISNEGEEWLTEAGLFAILYANKSLDTASGVKRWISQIVLPSLHKGISDKSLVIAKSDYENLMSFYNHGKKLEPYLKPAIEALNLLQCDQNIILSIRSLTAALDMSFSGIKNLS